MLEAPAMSAQNQKDLRALDQKCLAKTPRPASS